MYVNDSLQSAHQHINGDVHLWMKATTNTTFLISEGEPQYLKTDTHYLFLTLIISTQSMRTISTALELLQP